MSIGSSDSPAGLNDLIEMAVMAESRGFDNLWMAQIFGLDAISTLSLAARETSKITLGTAVTPTYPRHPTALAQQALTAACASNGRFRLGIGLSHKMVIEDMMGFSYDRPALHMREYLSVLMPLLRNEAVDFTGEHYQVKLRHSFSDAPPVPVLIAALGPVMLKLAGAMADGTTTWMTGPRTLENHIIPTISAAAREAGKAAPRIVAGLPIAVTDDVAAAREKIAQDLVIYGMLPSYRAMLDREGVEGPGDLAIVGSESEVAARVQELRDLGVTHFNAAITEVAEDTRERTLDVLAAQLA